ncbi:Hypothetical predicted protein, partial [Marmota monax]
MEALMVWGQGGLQCEECRGASSTWQRINKTELLSGLLCQDQEIQRVELNTPVAKSSLQQTLEGLRIDAEQPVALGHPE